MESIDAILQYFVEHSSFVPARPWYKATQGILNRAVKTELVQVKDETMDDMEPLKEVLPDRQLESHEQQSSQFRVESLGTLDNQTGGSGDVPSSNEIPSSNSVGEVEKQTDLLVEPETPLESSQQPPASPMPRSPASAQKATPPEASPPDVQQNGGIGKGKGKRAVGEDEFHVDSLPPSILSEKAIDNRLRRVMRPRADGSMLVDESWVQQWHDKHNGGREKIMEMFEKVAYSVDWGCSKNTCFNKVLLAQG